jgi:DNA invertase Pin-like site-specific DNA recombinase
MKAFAYLRVSSQGQVGGDGFDRQREAIAAYAAAHGLTIVDWFEERGVSGTVEGADRPAWSEMMRRLHSNGTRAVLVEKLDRVARDLAVQERAIATLRREGFELVSTQEPDLMAGDPSRVFMRQILGAVAQLDKSSLVAKLAGARARKAARGEKATGSYPFGHYPGESEAVELMKQLRADGLGFDRIAAELNRRGVPTRRGSKWGGNTINVVLTRLGAS